MTDPVTETKPLPPLPDLSKIAPLRDGIIADQKQITEIYLAVKPNWDAFEAWYKKQNGLSTQDGSVNKIVHLLRMFGNSPLGKGSGYGGAALLAADALGGFGTSGSLDGTGGFLGNIFGPILNLFGAG